MLKFLFGKANIINNKKYLPQKLYLNLFLVLFLKNLQSLPLNSPTLSNPPKNRLGVQCWQWGGGPGVGGYIFNSVGILSLMDFIQFLYCICP